MNTWHFKKSFNLKDKHIFNIMNYRHSVFVEHLKWELNLSKEGKINNLEYDQFDNNDTIYIYSRSPDGKVNSCARLLPTTSPYLLEKIFPELLNGVTPPKSKNIWEISRLTNISPDKNSLKTGLEYIENDFITLLNKTIEIAKENGAEHLISVSPLSMERLLRKSGFDIKRIGKPINYDNYRLVACWMNI